MTVAPLALFVFDLAGTTVHDDGHVRQAFERTAADFGLTLERDALRQFFGWHKQRVFEALLRLAGRELEPAAAMAEHFARVFAAGVAARPLRPTPGCREAIAFLQARGILVAFNTGFARSTADLVLAALGYAHLPSVASDEVANGRPAPDLIRAAMQRTGVTDAGRVGVVGDTPADLGAGHAAGCRFNVGVATGAFPLADLAVHPHTHLLPDLRGLPAVLHATSST
ncbi:MAG: HAD hydrolase-like protein [Planctomycetes bacterium]|nr:HAD hydrolase-like protein [Planctomycetota bacterium]